MLKPTVGMRANEARLISGWNTTIDDTKANKALNGTSRNRLLLYLPSRLNVNPIAPAATIPQ